jgi:hypothetical protein
MSDGSISTFFYGDPIMAANMVVFAEAVSAKSDPPRTFFTSRGGN